MPGTAIWTPVTFEPERLARLRDWWLRRLARADESLAASEGAARRADALPLVAARSESTSD